MLNLSKYLYTFERDGRYFLYAPLSNSFAELDGDVYKVIISAKEDSSNLNSLDEETVGLLRKMKVVDVDEKLEINRYKTNMLLRRFNNSHMSLTINPTLACNFACPYCFESSHKPIFMTDKVEDEIIAFVKKRTSLTNLNVMWFGGEPLLAFDRIVSLSKRMLGLGLGYKAGMLTNGYLLTPDKASQFEDLKISFVQITIDGSEKTHDSRRYRKDGSGTYQTILSNIDEAQKCSPNTTISVRVNVDKTNSNEFFEVFDYFQDKNYPNVSVYPAFVSEISEDKHNSCVYDDNAIAAFLVEVYKKRNYCSKCLYPSNTVHVCGIRNPNVVIIEPMGELYKCWNDVGDFSRSYGNIDGRMTNEAVLYEYMVEADYLNDPQCNDCIFFTTCDGGCPYRRIQNEKAGRAQGTCSLFKEHTEDFLMLRYDYRKRQDNHKN